MGHFANKAMERTDINSSSTSYEMLVLAETSKHTHAHSTEKHEITIQSSVENMCVHILIEYTLYTL